ncbi:MAG: DUF1569 domain-containing protein [Imperialibacter sp.]|jgi:hypothetical protein|uniref:DUF1569 domain-containing protein n=1 Tax=Imperialibacter sp. TaxID=2038411 RepID=UPI0032EDF7BC
MKTIFDKNTTASLIQRIRSLTAEQPNKWGKMSAYQMLKHCTLSEEMFLGKKKYERLFIGRLFGGMALKGMLKNEDPMKQNQPTHPEFKIKGVGNFDTEREKWIKLLHEYEVFPSTDFVHPFFGAMNKEQIGQYVYKHTDHHLRQFNA